MILPGRGQDDSNLIYSSLWNPLYLNSPPLPIPRSSRQDLYLFRAVRDELTLNTEVRPPSLTCVMDSLYGYLGLRLVDNLRHYSTE